MPFPLRTVSPRRLRRLEAEEEEEEGRDGGPPPLPLLLGSLEEASSRALVSLLGQLSDLSRCAGDLFGGIQSQAEGLGLRSARLRRRLDALGARANRLDHRKVPVPVSNLDEESRWTVHYTAPWHQQENVFLPSTRPPCVEDLHRQAKLNLKSVLRECDKLRRDGYRSSQYYSQGPTFSSSSSALCGNYQDDYEEIEQKCSTPSPEEEKLISIKRPKTPISNEFSDINTQTNWTKSLPLPTPEEKMREQAQAVQTDVIPINVTGENFDRQASIRRSLIYTDTVVRRPKKVKRRKTITGIPDNIQRELVGTGKNDFRGHSICIPEHYSTLGRLDSYLPSMQHCDTKDSSCQTDEVKVVPPSVRRIRAQKGQGIAAQMSQLSSSSGNMSVMSDSAGIVFASRLNNDLGFHSLPRSGARVSLQLLERRHSLSKSTEDGALSHQISKLQVGDSTEHIRNNSRVDVLQRTKSQAVRSSEGEHTESPACMVSPHATYSTSIIPNATLSSSSEVIAIHTTHGAGLMDSKIDNASSYSKPRDNLVANSMVNTKDQHHSSSGTWSETSSTHHSQSSDTTISSNAVMVIALGDSGVSLSDAGTVENCPQNIVYSCRNNLNFPNHSEDSDNRSESNYLVDKIQGRSQNGRGHSGFRHPGNEENPMHKPDCATPGCSTPVSNLSTSSLERVSAKEDSGSLYSVDHDGYYTSMHVDSGLKSGKTCNNNNNGFGNSRHNVSVFDGNEKKSLGDVSNCTDKSLSRSISLKKAKKPPLPPSRTDSLRRIPKKKSQSNGQVLDDMLIATLEHSLQLNLRSKNGSSPSQSPCSDYDDPWVLRSRSQSSVSASSSMMSATGLNMYSICAVTPSQSETSSIKSEYADQWGYYSDYPGMPDDQLKSPVVHSANTTLKLNDYNAVSFNDASRASAPHVTSGLSKPKTTSPEKSHRVTSPSSGYSSQSNTPTALTPVPVILKSVSNGNGKAKMKPKVPERKSSLLSSVSVSSSSTSLSSNTSAEGCVNVKKPDPDLSFPLVTPSPLMSPYTADHLLPPPPPALMDGMDLSPPPGSPNFPPPPPEAIINATFPQHDTWLNNEDPSMSHFFPSEAPPFSSPFSSSFAPPAPSLDPKFTKAEYKHAPHSFKKYNQQGSNHSTIKQPLNKEDPTRPAMPLVTSQALQMVQLRSVRKSVMSEGEQSVESASRTKSQEKLTEVQSPLKSCVSVRQSNSLDESEVNPHRVFDKGFVYSPSQTSYPGLSGINPEHIGQKMPENATNPTNFFANDLLPASAEEEPVEYQSSHCGLSSLSFQGQSLSKPQGMSRNKKPPPVSKKPKLFLIVPPPQPDVKAEKIAEVGETVRSIPSVTTRDAAVTQSSQARDYPTDGLYSNEMDSGNLVPEGGAMGSPSCETLETNVLTLQSRQEQPCLYEGISCDRNGDSISRTDRQLSQGDESDMLESDAASSFLLQSPNYGEDNMGTAMPPRPRTTEDLFAAIHRSKRKVLGRKDSEEERIRNHSPSPPVTPTGASPIVASLKQAGSIQRNIRKSSTSNDNFKALLLKKGSRSDTSSRMSAAEMLKNTDPRFQRAKVDSPWDYNDSTTSCSPTKNRRAQEEWAKSEGLMPRSLSFSSARYSRSRTPPSAASSKYSVRNRIQSSPMTVISEGDVEAIEPAESRTNRSLEEEDAGQLDVFDSDEMDINEDAGSSDDTTGHLELIT
ncbi:NHS-like protein 1 isoform X2 [Sceloporus undulatus]|uniref:NHS-like protein 1 isoform X2 n=1 Tax=Sceloporus undulatus TaxID=8520 RepID=UPI001C4B44FB|nr:NHS-like protein 1 isoform X2 [Sceloporus undulatus]